MGQGRGLSPHRVASNCELRPGRGSRGSRGRGSLGERLDAGGGSGRGGGAWEGRRERKGARDAGTSVAEVTDGQTDACGRRRGREEGRGRTGGQPKGERGSTGLSCACV